MAVYYIWAYRLFGLILRLHVEDGVRRFVPIIFLLASHGDDDTGYTAAAGDHVLIEAYYRGRPTFCIVLARPVSSVLGPLACLAAAPCVAFRKSNMA